MTQTFTALLLAGDRPGDPLAEVAPGKRKALLPLRGRPMILYVLETLNAAAAVGEIVVVANDVADIAENPHVAAFAAKRPLRFREGAAGPAASVLKVCEELSGRVLVTTADNPLLSVATLGDFCTRALADDIKDVVVGLAREKDIREAFPEARRTYLRMRDGGVSGCNLFAGAADALARGAAGWVDVESKRKKPLAFIAHFGGFTLLRALTGMLSLKNALDAVSRTLGVRAGAVMLDDPLAAMDVDRFDHVAMAELVLSRR
ncbi:MAG: nucleotidyltransferase family protein [Rhodospirillaceae bacterium]